MTSFQETQEILQGALNFPSVCVHKQQHNKPGNGEAVRPQLLYNYIHSVFRYVSTYNLGFVYAFSEVISWLFLHPPVGEAADTGWSLSCKQQPQ